MGMRCIPPKWCSSTLGARWRSWWLWAAAAVGGDRLEAVAVVGGSCYRQRGGGWRQNPAQTGQNRGGQRREDRARWRPLDAGEHDGGFRGFEWAAAEWPAVGGRWWQREREKEAKGGGVHGWQRESRRGRQNKLGLFPCLIFFIWLLSFLLFLANLLLSLLLSHWMACLLFYS